MVGQGGVHVAVQHDVAEVTVQNAILVVRHERRMQVLIGVEVLGVARRNRVAHTLVPVVLVHHGIQIAVHIFDVAILVNADRQHVTHGTQGAVFILVCRDVVHFFRKRARPEQGLVYGLIRTPPACQHMALCITLGVARALLLLLHEARVPVHGIGGAKHVA